MTVISRQSSVGGHSRQSQSAVGSHSRSVTVGDRQTGGGAVALAWRWRSCTAAAMQPAKATLVYIGTYTGAKSKGIYVSRLDLVAGTLSRRFWRRRAPTRASWPCTRARPALRGERGRDVRGQAGRVGQRVRDQPRDRRAIGPEPAVVDGRRPGASDRRPRRPERAGGELWRWKRRGPADRSRRRVETSRGLHPAHGFERQP